MAPPIMAACYLCQRRLKPDEAHHLPITRRPADSDKPTLIVVCQDAVACQIRRNRRAEAQVVLVRRREVTAHAG